MIDITTVTTDINLYDTDIYRATNILSTQVNYLEYAQDLGIDMKYFLDPEFRFQNDTFKSYLIQILANYGINVASLDETINSLFVNYNFVLVPKENSTSLIAR